MSHARSVGELFKGEGSYWPGPTWTEIAARGRWADADTFAVTLTPLEGVLDDVLRLDWTGDAVTATLTFRLYGEQRTLFSLSGAPLE